MVWFKTTVSILYNYMVWRHCTEIDVFFLCLPSPIRHGLYNIQPGQDNEFVDYTSSVQLLKELIHALPVDSSQVELQDGEEHFGKEKIMFLVTMLDGFVVSREFNLALTAFSEVENAPLSQQAAKNKALATLTLKARAMAKLCEKATNLLSKGNLDRDDMAASNSILALSWLAKMEKSIESAQLKDILSLKVCELMEEIGNLKREASRATGDQHDPGSENFWRLNLHDETVDLLVKTAKETICNSDGVAVGNSIVRFEKACGQGSGRLSWASSCAGIWASSVGHVCHGYLGPRS